METSAVQDNWEYATDPDKVAAYWERELQREREKTAAAEHNAATHRGLSLDYEQKWREALRQQDIIRQKANARTTLDALTEVRDYLRSEFVDGQMCKLPKTQREGAKAVIEHVNALIGTLEANPK
jgi:hypothetical protein